MANADPTEDMRLNGDEFDDLKVIRVNERRCFVDVFFHISTAMWKKTSTKHRRSLTLITFISSNSSSRQV